ncbi:MAG: hypothetical protein U9R16_03170 [Campylobacterota bacterium]|nr:hypothetical protein [Campylobacterota bacterium]
MLSIKEMAEQFDIPKTTLYGWKTERPKVYDYLANSNDQYKKYREVNIFLDTYIKTANINIFTIQEIEYITTLNILLDDIQQMQNIHIIYINASTKIKKENDLFTLDIYNKLESLNLIEKYIFCDRLKIFASKSKVKKDEKMDLMEHYFKEFLEL